MRQNIGAAPVGNLLEWDDFAVYGFMAAMAGRGRSRRRKDPAAQFAETATMRSKNSRADDSHFCPARREPAALCLGHSCPNLRRNRSHCWGAGDPGRADRAVRE